MDGFNTADLMITCHLSDRGSKSEFTEKQMTYESYEFMN